MAGIKRSSERDYRPRKTRRLETEAEERDPDSDIDSIEDVESDSEGEGWGGIEGDASNAAVDGVSAGHVMNEQGQSGGKYNKPPTGQELRIIKDAIDLYQSSSFKLQIDALIPNVRPKPKRSAPLDRFLLSLYKFLMNLPSTPLQHPLDASRKFQKHGIAIPYPIPPPNEDTNWKVAFEKPSEITVVGSWPNNLSVKAKDDVPFGVDLALEMPASLFQEKDYLNGRFFHKKAFYLASIAHAIQNASETFAVELLFESLSDDPRLTKLVLRHKPDNSPTDFTKTHASVCLIPVVTTQCPIPLHRLSPSHSNIRVNTSTEEHDSKPVHLPTPLYNSALLRHFTLKSHLIAFSAFKNESSAFGDALTLLRVWANQRGYGDGTHLAVRGFHGRGAWWSMLLGCLIEGEEPVDPSSRDKRRPLGRGLSSYQLFRAALDFLAKHDFSSNPVFSKTKNGHLYPPAEYQEHHKVTFVDPSSRLNMLSGIPVGSLEILRHDARKTLETLDRPLISGDTFSEVFLKEHRGILTRFDTVIKVDLSLTQVQTQSPHAALDCGSPVNAVLDSLDSLLHLTLGDRAKAITLLHAPPSSRPLSQAHPTNPNTVYIGLIHDPQHAFRLVDHGPAADETDEQLIARFRDLWGEKAELRRFKDGRIIESVVWDVKTIDERSHVPAMIVRYILQRHFNIPPSSVVTWQSDFDSVLKLPETISSLYHGSGLTLGFKGAITAFDNIVKTIKGLGDDLPLALTSISSTSPSTRYTSVFSPVPLPSSIATALPHNSRYLAPIEIVFEFEKSSRWPDDIRAVQQIKLAFFERIASSLMAAVTGLKAAVVTGDGVSTSDIIDQSYLEIITPDGWAFWARIWHDREITLLDRIIEGRHGVLPHVTLKPEDKQRNQEHYDAVEAKEVLARRFIHGPRHHRAIASLAHQHSAFSGTARLVKRWLASHWLLSTHVSEEVIELICASLFVGSKPQGKEGDDQKREDRASVPTSKERGFALVVDFLQGWAWEDGLFVPLYATESPGETGDQSSPSAPPHTSSVWSVKTELDKSGHVWTHCGPDVVAAHRMRALAKATWAYLRRIEDGEFSVKSVFVHPTSDYDFIVELDKTALCRYHHNVTADLVSFSKRTKQAISVQDVMPGFDPAHFLFNDLQRIYANTFKLFYDAHGGDRYGGVWDPSLKEPRPFRVLGNFSSMPVPQVEKSKEKGMVALNKESVLAEIQRIGSGLVVKVVMNT